MFDKVYLGQRTGGLDIGKKPLGISKVTVLVDSEHFYSAGDESGRQIEVTCPWGTPKMAENILSCLKGHVFLPYEATDALLDPAAEIGDGITVGGIYSVVSNIETRFDKMCAANVSEPGTDEIDDEYPYESGQKREISRKLAYTRSLITKTVNSITLDVSNEDVSSTIKLMVGGIELASKEIRMEGLVTFSGLKSGTTTIDGGCIKTGTIDAERLNLTGAITFSDLSKAVKADIDDAYYMAENAQSLAEDVDDTVSGWRYQGTTYIDGTMLKTGTVMASELLGGTVGLLDKDEEIVGGIDITNTQTGYGLDFWTYYGGVRISSGGNFWVDATYGSFGLTSSGLVSEADVVPESNSAYSLGLSGKRWTDVYADNDTIVTSDLQVKKEVIYGLEQYEELFDKLKPISFLFVNGSSGRRHIGFGAQDVEEILDDLGILTKDFAGFIKSPVVDDSGQIVEGQWNYALRYGEFIALCVDQIQKLKKRVSDLEEEIS